MPNWKEGLLRPLTPLRKGKRNLQKKGVSNRSTRGIEREGENTEVGCIFFSSLSRRPNSRRVKRHDLSAAERTGEGEAEIAMVDQNLRSSWCARGR